MAHTHKGKKTTGTEQGTTGQATKKSVEKTMATEQNNPNLGMTPEFAARFASLFNNRHYADQTEKGLWTTILNAGIKAVEKRRKNTADSQLEKAVAVLKARGVDVEIPS